VEPDLFSRVADVLSILGFLASLYAALGIKRLRAFYVFKTRVPQLTRRLTEHKSNLSRHLSEGAPARFQMREEVTTLAVTLVSLERKLPRPTKRRVHALAEQLERYGPDPSEAQLRRTYLELAALVEEITNLQEDLEWQQR
jgi:hypothetical protein